MADLRAPRIARVFGSNAAANSSHYAIKAQYADLGSGEVGSNVHFWKRSGVLTKVNSKFVAKLLK